MTSSLLTLKAQSSHGVRNQAIAHTVYNAVWPYYPGDVTVYTDFEIDYCQYRVVIEASNFRDFRFITHLDRDDIIEDPIVMEDRLCEELFEFYRFLPVQPSGDHIILGEN